MIAYTDEMRYMSTGPEYRLALTVHLAGSMTDTPDRIPSQPGTIVVTLGALEIATHQQIASILAPHLSGGRGEVGTPDAAVNERALTDGERLLAIHDVNGQKLWVLSEAERSVTTVLRPYEY